MMQENLLKIWAQFGNTVLFVTHDVDEAIFLADRVLVMSASPGRIIADFPVELNGHATSKWQRVLRSSPSRNAASRLFERKRSKLSSSRICSRPTMRMTRGFGLAMLSLLFIGGVAIAGSFVLRERRRSQPS